MASTCFLILAHGLPYQTIDLVWSIWRPEDHYFVHIDSKSPSVTFAALSALAASYRNVHIVPSDLCAWGGFSIVEAEWRCVQTALNLEKNWSHAILLSGTHIPLKSPAKIAGLLEPELSYFPFHSLDIRLADADPPTWWGLRARRITYRHLEVPGIGLMQGTPRDPVEGVDYYWGSQWWILSRSAAEYIGTAWRSRLAEYFRHTAVPDESCFQTLLLNSSLKEAIVHRQTVWQQWGESGRPLLLSADDLKSALASRQFFARKASESLMRDSASGWVAAVGAMNRVSWEESVVAAFDRFMPAALKSMAIDRYCSGQADAENEPVEGMGASHPLLREITNRIESYARIYGLNPALHSQPSGVDAQAMLTCSFPGSRSLAKYALILRTCSMQTAWIGVYVTFPERARAIEDLSHLPDTDLVDFTFPPAAGLHPNREFLKIDLKKLGVVSLTNRNAVRELDEAIRIYLEILSQVPGIREDNTAQ